MIGIQMVGTPRCGCPVNDIMNNKNNENNENYKNNENNKNNENYKNKDSSGHKTDRHGGLSVPYLKANNLFI